MKYATLLSEATEIIQQSKQNRAQNLNHQTQHSDTEQSIDCAYWSEFAWKNSAACITQTKESTITSNIKNGPEVSLPEDGETESNGSEGNGQNYNNYGPSRFPWKNRKAAAQNKGPEVSLPGVVETKSYGSEVNHKNNNNSGPPEFPWENRKAATYTKQLKKRTKQAITKSVHSGNESDCSIVCPKKEGKKSS